MRLAVACVVAAFPDSRAGGARCASVIKLRRHPTKKSQKYISRKPREIPTFLTALRKFHHQSATPRQSYRGTQRSLTTR